MCVCVSSWLSNWQFVVFANGHLITASLLTVRRKLMSADWFSWILQGFVMPCSVSLRVDLFGNVGVFPASVSFWCKSHEIRLQVGFADLAKELMSDSWHVDKSIQHPPRTHKALSHPGCSTSEGRWRMFLWDERGKGVHCSPSQRHYRESSCKGLARCPRTQRLDSPDKITDLNIQYTVHLHLSLEISNKVEALLYQWMFPCKKRKKK